MWWNALSFLRPQSLRSEAPDGSGELLRQLQELRLELDERDQLVDTLKCDLERHQRRVADQLANLVQARIEEMLTRAAAPLAQLVTQAHLVESEGKTLKAKDVLAVAKRLAKTFVDEGLTMDEVVGETRNFDPGRHEPLASSDAPEPGDPVTIRFVGVSFRGRILRKAAIDLIEVK